MTPCGTFIDVGGRRLRTVVAGPPGVQPLVVLIHGSFGSASDWAVVQDGLAALGLRSLAYDRAGMGYSDPGPKPRDGDAVLADLAILLETLGEAGPLVLAGHSMAGLFVRQLALAWPQRVRGVVFVDAVAPDLIDRPDGKVGVRAYARSLRWVEGLAALGLMRPAAALIGDRIGLPAPASRDKRRTFGLAAHAQASAEEVEAWPATAAQACGDCPPELPVAVVIAGAGRVVPRKGQDALARASRHGHVEVVGGARHADVLGRRHAQAVVRGVEHVLRAAVAAATG